MRFALIAFVTMIYSAPFSAQAKPEPCVRALELKQNLAKILYVRSRYREAIAEIWNGFERINVEFRLPLLLTTEELADFSIKRMPYVLVTWDPKTKEVVKAQVPLPNEGPAVITRNMANIRLWLETSSGIGLTTSLDKIDGYRGEFLKEELGNDVEDFVWVRWDPETLRVQAVYL